MAWNDFKARAHSTAIFLVAAAIIILSARSCSESSVLGRLKLPVGHGTPAISLGERHGLILASDGSLWSWGADFLGWPVLGLGAATHRTTSLRRIGNDTNWAGISAGVDHNLAVKSDGTLWTWGASVRARWIRAAPSSVPVRAAPGHDWKQAAAGGIGCVALKKDGTLWSWGDNWSGSVGSPSTNGSSVPMQIGSGTNWTKVWAGTLETMALQSDGSLWYWGDNPNPAIPQGAGQVFIPTRVSPDTNWVDAGFGVNTVFAIKANGSLWVWGRQAHAYTGVTNTAQDAIPTRVGTNSDWRSLSDTPGWWCQGLIKKDGSLWLLDASQGRANGPSYSAMGMAPFNLPMQYRRVPYKNYYAAYAGGAVHAAAAGVHGPIGVVLTPEGEVWTWGMVMGDPPSFLGSLQAFASRIARFLHFNVSAPDPPPVYREKPWQLRNDG